MRQVRRMSKAGNGGTWRAEGSDQGTASESSAGECGRQERQYRRKRDGTAGRRFRQTDRVRQDKMQTSTSDSTKKKRSPGKIILLAILVLCASPVSLALMFSVLAVLFAVVVVIAAVIFSLGVASIATIAGGIMVAGFGATLILKSVAAACMMVGGGFLMAGAGILVGVLTIYICKWCATGIGRLVNRFVRKKVQRNE